MRTAPGKTTAASRWWTATSSRAPVHSPRTPRSHTLAATRQRISEQTAALIDALLSATGPNAVKVAIADTPQADAIYDPVRTTVLHGDGATRPANLTGTPAAYALAHLTVLLQTHKGDTLTADLTAATLSRS